MTAIYYDSLKMLPSSTMFEDVLNIPNVIILPYFGISYNTVANHTFKTRTTVQMIGHGFPGPDRDLLTILFNQSQKHRKELKKSEGVAEKTKGISPLYSFKTLHVKAKNPALPPEGDIPRPWDREPGINEPYIPEDPGDLPLEPDDEDTEEELQND